MLVHPLYRRRRLGWDPRRLPGLVLHLDAKSEAARRGFAIGDDAIALDQWSDDSGEGNHATQATAGARPVLDDDGARPVVRFDGSDDFLALTLNPALSQPNTLLVAFRHRTGSVAATEVVAAGEQSGGTSLSHAFYVTNGTPDAVSGFAGTAVALFDLDDAWHVLSGIFDGASSSFWNNGAETAGSAGTRDVDDFAIGAQPNGNAPAAVDISAVILCSGALSDADRARAERWLNSRYGLGVL